MLMRVCEEHSIKVHLAKADADTLIVASALDEAKKGDTAVVVGQDTDLLVLLAFLASKKDNVFFLRSASDGKRQESLFHIPRQKTALGKSCDVILFVHAVTGCDTTSSLYKKGKLNALKLLKNNLDLIEELKVFENPNAMKEEVVKTGEKFLIRLYGGKLSTLLDSLRYYRYNDLISKQPVGVSFQLASLPPTSDAAALHSMRMYLQIQEWKDNNLEPYDWGWKKTDKNLNPLYMTKSPAPLSY